jgi:hypothetical protein
MPRSLTELDCSHPNHSRMSCRPNPREVPNLLELSLTTLSEVNRVNNVFLDWRYCIFSSTCHKAKGFHGWVYRLRTAWQNLILPQGDGKRQGWSSLQLFGTQKTPKKLGHPLSQGFFRPTEFPRSTSVFLGIGLDEDENKPVAPLGERNSPEIQCFFPKDTVKHPFT